MIIFYSLEPLEEKPYSTTSSSSINQQQLFGDDQRKLKPFTIQNDFKENIVMSTASGNSEPIIRLLFDSGRVWKSCNANTNDCDDDDEGDYAFSGQFIELFGPDKGMIVTFIDSFTYTGLYLVRDLKRGGRTLLYGDGRDYYKSLANSKSEGVRLVFDPNSELKADYFVMKEITHIASCFSFSCCVLDRRDIRVCGQNWIGAGSDPEWTKSQFVAEEDIVDIRGGNFHLVAYLKDHRFLVAGSASHGQTLSTSNPSYFTYVTLDFPIRSFSCSSSRTLVECQDNTFRMYGSSGSGNDNNSLKIPHPFDSSLDIESALLFREPIVFVPKNHSNILIFCSGSNCQKYNISDYFPNNNYKTIGIQAHSKCLLIYPKRNQLVKFWTNMRNAYLFGHFSDISFPISIY